VIAIPAGVVLADFVRGETAEAAKASVGLSGPVIGSVAVQGSKDTRSSSMPSVSLHRTVPERACCSWERHTPDMGRAARARPGAWAKGVVFTGSAPTYPRCSPPLDCFVLASTRTEGVPQSLLQASPPAYRWWRARPAAFLRSFATA
jgi:hypothetical protein